jgi:large subunit ribosomal protein L3e
VIRRSHVVREVNKPGSKLHKKEAVEMVTILETPPMIVVGLVGYVATPRGLRTLTTVWSHHLTETVKRRFYRNWYRAKKKAFSRYAANITANGDADVKAQIKRIEKYCSVIRVPADRSQSLAVTGVRPVQPNSNLIKESVAVPDGAREGRTC